jgi:hypothetical protein
VVELTSDEESAPPKKKANVSKVSLLDSAFVELNGV